MTCSRKAVVIKQGSPATSPPPLLYPLAGHTATQNPGALWPLVDHYRMLARPLRRCLLIHNNNNNNNNTTTIPTSTVTSPDLIFWLELLHALHHHCVHCSSSEHTTTVPIIIGSFFICIVPVNQHIICVPGISVYISNYFIRLSSSCTYVRRVVEEDDERVGHGFDGSIPRVAHVVLSMAGDVDP